MSLFVEVQYAGDWWGEDPITETAWNTPGELFRSLAGKGGGRPWEALGRCTGKVYVDVPGSPCTLCHLPKTEHEYSYPANPISTELVEPGGTSADGRVWPNGMVGALEDPKHPGGMALQHYYQAEAQHVGWVFVARNPEPTNRGDEQPTGLREAWVTVYTAEPDVTVTRVNHYADLSARKSATTAEIGG